MRVTSDAVTTAWQRATQARADLALGPGHSPLFWGRHSHACKPIQISFSDTETVPSTLRVFLRQLSIKTPPPICPLANLV